MKQLTRRGIGCQRKQAQPIHADMEQELWGRNLEVSQFTIGTDANGKYLRFFGRNCKNLQGGLMERKIEPKDLKIYSKPELKERCVTNIFKPYSSRRSFLS